MEDDPNNANCNWVCPACASYERRRTHFKDPNNTSNYIYEDKSSGSPTWKTCSDNLCTEDPFTSICSAVKSGDSKLGVLCELNCLAGQVPVSAVSVSVSAPSNTCKPLTNVRGKICCDEYGCNSCGQEEF